MSSMFLRGERGSLAGSQAAVTASPFTIGRSPDNHLVLAESQASRRHAQLQLHEGRWWLQDLNSSNGTLINRERLDPGRLVPLHDGDVIEIGDTAFAVIVHEAIRPEAAAHAAAAPRAAAGGKPRVSLAVAIAASIVLVAVVVAMVWFVVSRSGKKDEATGPSLPRLELPDIELPTALPKLEDAGDLLAPLETALPGLKLPFGTAEP